MPTDRRTRRAALDRRAFLGLGTGLVAATVLARVLERRRRPHGGLGAGEAGVDDDHHRVGGSGRRRAHRRRLRRRRHLPARPREDRGPVPARPPARSAQHHREPRPAGHSVSGCAWSTRDCAPVPGAAVEIWHCDATGDYSAFHDGGGGKDAGPGTTFLRGTQPVTADGIVEFATHLPRLVPGAGRAHPPARPPRRRHRADLAALLPRRLHRRRVPARRRTRGSGPRTPATRRTASRATRRPRARCSPCATPTPSNGTGTLGCSTSGMAA